MMLFLESFTTFEYVSLMQSCKFAKESISPNTRKVAVELKGELYPVSVADFYDACSPRLLEAIDLAVQVAGDAGRVFEQDPEGYPTSRQPRLRHEAKGEGTGFFRGRE